MVNEYLITEVIDPESNEQWPGTANMHLWCPVCKSDYQHFGMPIHIPGNDDYSAGWGGRGDLLTIPIEGECGHNWELCIGFHKGNSVIFARVI